MLATLQRAGAALTPGEVKDLIGGDLAYTTVVTILSRLHAKGVLARHKDGRAYRYAPVSDQPGLAARRMARVLDEENDRAAVLARFVSSLSESDEDLLRRMLAGSGLARISGVSPCQARAGADMHVAVYVPLLIPALAALAARPLAARLRPAVATWLLTLSALALAAASSAVLGMLALSALLRIPFVDGVGHLSDPVISRGDAVSLPVAIIAGGLLAAAAVAASRAVWRRAAAIGAAYRRARTLPGAGEIVVTDDAAADAYTIPGWPCRIVITRGMLERAGRGGTRRAARPTSARTPGTRTTCSPRPPGLPPPPTRCSRPVAGEVCYAVERWADEHAAAEAGDRALTARADRAGRARRRRLPAGP